ncbi:MAG: hypothetical protein CSA70_00825 [Rhodobacterales bacterium]|nr:MAG: hypothetical protein CSA70_00825 [Rhodobacterales bacterium]
MAWVQPLVCDFGWVAPGFILPGTNGKTQRFDEIAEPKTAPKGTRRDLFAVMKQDVETKQGPRTRVPSMGCSTKWKAA